MKLKDKVCIVTGAASGIAKALRFTSSMFMGRSWKRWGRRR